MVFSSFGFLFAFFPLFFLGYYLLDPRYRNFFVLFMSLAFYAIGEGQRLFILIVSILGNYIFGYLVQTFLTKNKQLAARSFLICGVIFNLALLAYFKYADFVIRNLDVALSRAGFLQQVSPLQVILPLGISFFAFQGISYLVDIYRGKIMAPSSLFSFATYKSMFPQLIAGPIVRYADVEDDMGDRRVEPDEVLNGLGRFVRGLTKKVLIADTMAVTADAIFALPAHELSLSVAWLGVIAYTLQIYFDFSGYSDMAIAMGQMMGFKFPENFDHPYTSKSIGEFWRRWHMTLSSWFRDYVYFPLGGNRLSLWRTYGNLIAVFALTGLWHGASWTFVVWGLWHGLFMLIERRSDPETWKVPQAIRHVYVMMVVMIGWALFRADSSEGGSRVLKSMFGFGVGGDRVWPLSVFLNSLVIMTLVVGVVFSTPAYKALYAKIPETKKLPFSVVIGATLLFFASLKVLSGAYSPFLYFRF